MISRRATEQADAGAQAGLRQRKKDSSRRAIEDAAWELFAEQGYEETSVNDIAERADVAPRTFFRYFPTKEAVMYPQFEQLLQSVRDQFHRRPADEPVITSLFESLEMLAGSLESEDSRARERMAMMKRPGRHPPGTEYFRTRLAEVIAELVLEREGDSDEARMRARLASGVVSLLIDTTHNCWIEAGARESMHDVGERCRGMMSDLIGTMRRM
ncbi:MAG TPA: TetR family transcriptional regulator [Ilumatobacteraceae bacterium]|nr:TetR family transcriptional regulator [Ilumatobacteraceae bacterium]